MTLTQDIQRAMEIAYPERRSLLGHLLRDYRLRWMVYTNRGVPTVQLDGYHGQIDSAAAIVTAMYDVETISSRSSLSRRGQTVWTLPVVGKKASPHP